MLHKRWRYTYYYIIFGKVYLCNVNYAINNMFILYKISFIDVKKTKHKTSGFRKLQQKFLSGCTYDLCYD